MELTGNSFLSWFNSYISWVGIKQSFGFLYICSVVIAYLQVVTSGFLELEIILQSSLVYNTVFPLQISKLLRTSNASLHIWMKESIWDKSSVGCWSEGCKKPGEERDSAFSCVCKWAVVKDLGFCGWFQQSWRMVFVNTIRMERHQAAFWFKVWLQWTVFPRLVIA